MLKGRKGMGAKYVEGSGRKLKRERDKEEKGKGAGTGNANWKGIRKGRSGEGIGEEKNRRT